MSQSATTHEKEREGNKQNDTFPQLVLLSKQDFQRDGGYGSHVISACHTTNSHPLLSCRTPHNAERKNHFCKRLYGIKGFTKNILHLTCWKLFSIRSTRFMQIYWGNVLHFMCPKGKALFNWLWSSSRPTCRIFSLPLSNILGIGRRLGGGSWIGLPDWTEGRPGDLLWFF